MKSLPLNTSVNQGIEILSGVEALPDGTETTVFRVLPERHHLGTSTVRIHGRDRSHRGHLHRPRQHQVHHVDFVLVGNELNPGGFLSRFTTTAYAPALDRPTWAFRSTRRLPRTPIPRPTTHWNTTASPTSPRYPLNLLADLNAGLGLALVHTKYAPGPNCRTC